MLPGIEPPSSAKTDRTPFREGDALFSWVHLSDIHQGHGRAKDRADQKIVLSEIRADLADLSKGKWSELGTLPPQRPDAILVTGDIAYSAAPAQYKNSARWIGEVASTLGLEAAAVFLVPGNHDFDRRQIDRDEHLELMLDAVRAGVKGIDEFLASPARRKKLNRVHSAFLSFAAGFAPVHGGKSPFWTHRLRSRGLSVRLVGLNTSYVATGNDKGKLEVGKEQFAATLSEEEEDELTIVLTHHPFESGWLTTEDEQYARNRVGKVGHIHLCGHVHEARTRELWKGSGQGLVTVVAGAAHEEAVPDGIRAMHGYNVASVVIGEGGMLRLRVWPRRWSDIQQEFYTDVELIDRSRGYAEHRLQMRVPLQREEPPPPSESARSLGVPIAPFPGAAHALLPYLERIAANYKWLKLQGLKDAGSLQIELERVYVALSADPRSEYDRQQVGRLHDLEIAEAAGVASISEITPGQIKEFEAANLRETHRPPPRTDPANNKNLGEVVRRYRRLVILGDPGSGKSTLARWLALQFARALSTQLESGKPAQVHVPIGQVNPDLLPGTKAATLFDLGPARLPIFLRIANFSWELARREHERLPTISLIDYLGKDSESDGLGDQLSPEKRNVLFREMLDKDAAIVVLDGLDELAESNRRLVVIKIQEFIEAVTKPNSPPPEARRNLASIYSEAFALYHDVLQEHGAQKAREPARESALTVASVLALGSPRARSLAEQLHRAADAVAEPWEVGGNQVIVTSRETGYKLTPVRAGCAHFGIDKMSRLAVEHFSRSWTDAVNTKLCLASDDCIRAEALIAEIYSDSRPAIRELATNPLLVTILATVYLKDRRLPEQRAAVYDRVVENLLRIWLEREECRTHHLNREELLAAVEPLAATMQETSGASMMISLDRISELVTGPLASMRDMDPEDRRFRPVRDALLATIRDQVGLLAEQSPGNYSFFHRTFQEFLAARYLLNQRDTVSALASRLDDPIWREPLLLAIGFAMVDEDDWGPMRRERLLVDLLAADTGSSLIPRAALTITTALPGLDRAPANVAAATTRKLLIAYELSVAQTSSSYVCANIESTFRRLREGIHESVIFAQLVDAVRDCDDQGLATAAAILTQRIDWIKVELVEALISNLHRDRVDRGWPMHRTLERALGRSNIQSARMFANVRYLLPMRRLLEANRKLLIRVQSDVDWARLLMSLYGAFRRPKTDSPGLGSVKEPVSVERLLVRSAADLSMAVSEMDIVHDLWDADLSKTIRFHLSAGYAARELVPHLEKAWANHAPLAAAEALVGLGALGVDVLPRIRTALADSDRHAAAQAAIMRFTRVRDCVNDSLLASANILLRTIPDSLEAPRAQDLLEGAVDVLMDAGCHPLDISASIAGCRFVRVETSEARAALDAEYWSALFSKPVEEALLTLCNSDMGPAALVEDIVNAWAVLHSAGNFRSPHAATWSHVPLQPRPRCLRDAYLIMLDAMAGAPPAYDVVTGRVLGMCQPVVAMHPYLSEETRILILSRSEEFLVAFLGASDSFVLTERVIANFPAQDGEALRAMEGEGFTSRRAFLQRAAECLGDVRLGEVRDILLNAARVERVTKSALFMGGAGSLSAQERVLDWCLQAPSATVIDYEKHLLPLVTASAHDPQSRLRAIERLMMMMPPIRSSLLAEVGKHVAAIDDAENRARARARLGFLYEGGKTAIDEIFAAIEQVADECRRAQLLREIRVSWGRVLPLAEHIRELAKGMSNPWLRARATGRVWEMIEAHRHQFDMGALTWRCSPGAKAVSFRRRSPTGLIPWGLLYLWSIASEVKELGAASSSGVWPSLLGPEPEASVATLVASHIYSSIAVSQTEVAILDRLVQAGRAGEFEELWSILECSTLDSRIRPWLSRRDVAGQWCALVLAESGQMNNEIADRLTELVNGNNDRLRHRASLALHGHAPHFGGSLRWKTSRIGFETLLGLGLRATDASCSHGLRTTLSWMCTSTHHDDGVVLERLLSEAKGVGGRARAAAWALASMWSLDEGLVERFLEGYDTPSLHQTMLKASAGIHANSGVFAPYHKTLIAAIRGIPTSVRAEVWGFASGPSQILKITSKVISASTNTAERLALADGALRNELVWLRDANLASVLSTLKELHHGRCVRLNSYWDDADKEAATINAIDETLKFLLVWIEAEQSRGDPHCVLPAILTAAQAVSRRSPGSFALLADPPGLWEALLTQFAISERSWTARMAAVQLLGHLRRVSNCVVSALRSAVQDVSFVQKAGFEAAREFRRVEGNVLASLFDMLGSPSACIAAATTRLLVTATKSGSIDRRRLLRVLERAFYALKSPRPVYIMKDADSMTMECMDRLDSVLYNGILDVSGWR